ncbi:MAG: tRNA (guanosine(37)-N1)-methyltransferase TrmD [Alphaproteobacteria bacterium]|nr:tRNA (guanosine(37)-N1)-methyltransferase TrmD [Alphaproteobacteria bacterium]HCP01604.1 tRNA (guanosine(37)-N1)-methyltransferase TrmD [Rhodospirillaceae bacterium]
MTDGWTATVLTLFPEMFPGSLGQSLAGRALAEETWRLDVQDIRTHAIGRRGRVDDEPFGGGPGMVMRPDIVDSALREAVNLVDDQRPIIYLTPRGCPLDQARVRGLADDPGVILLCGRYEGVDQRVLDAWKAEEISVGDYVLSGGEPAAVVLLDAVIRLLPGVMGTAESVLEESFERGLLEYPHYTRPADWVDWQGQEHRVPEILTSGHHGRIAEWRKTQAEQATRERRPDLWQQYAAREDEG